MNAHNVAGIGMCIFMGAGIILFFYSLIIKNQVVEYGLVVMSFLVIGSMFSRMWAETTKDRPKHHDWTDKEKEALK